VSNCYAGDNKEQNTFESNAYEKLELDGYVYKCADMARVVNYLRGLGKERALAVLKQHVKNGGPEDGKVIVICRCLFLNTKTWEDPDLGGPDLEVPEEATKAFPAFPIAFSKNVPFYLVGAYSSNGISHGAARCLKHCESLPLIDKDLPIDGYAAAAEALVGNESFKALYPDRKIRKSMAEMIADQANKRKEPVSNKGEEKR
jgi:hypothetical protein